MFKASIACPVVHCRYLCLLLVAVGISVFAVVAGAPPARAQSTALELGVGAEPAGAPQGAAVGPREAGEFPRGDSGRLEAASLVQRPAWRVSVPAGTRVIDLPAVPMAERAGKFVRMQPDLVIGGDPSDSNSLFYRALDIAVDSSGRMYIADVGNHRIQVFDQDGSFVRSLGRRGQGPGELETPQRVSIVGDKVFVWDTRKRRFLSWELDGSLGPELRMRSVRVASEVSSLDDGTLVLVHGRRPTRPAGGAFVIGTRQDYLVQAFGLDGEPGRIFLELESTFPRGSWNPYPAHAVDPSGIVYVSTADEYQILAIDAASGVARWALRVDTRRRSARETLLGIQAAVAKTNPDWAPADVARRVEEMKVPDLEDAIKDLCVDGHGHLYVVLDATREDLEAAQASRAIDVYSRDGERLFSGFLDNDGWGASSGDYVYDRETDMRTEEATFVRFLLQEPFE